jgi:hypothetical protein
MSDADATPAFSDDERRALACVLDLLIPRSGDGRLPAAGELGIAAHIERVVRHDLGLRMTLAEGVAALDALAQRHGAAGFAALAGADQLAALKQQAAAQPALLPGLIFHTYAGYYQAGQVLEGLGLEPRPPFPAGHVLEPFDATLLEPARRRGKLYRDA